jgi:hypothetical protein
LTHLPSVVKPLIVEAEGAGTAAGMGAVGGFTHPPEGQ